VEFEQLEAFVFIAQTKSFTRTAEILHIAQSTVTTRIKMLEQHLGKELFVRDNRRVELTSYGRVLLPYAKRIIELVQEGERVTAIEGQYDDHLVVGSLNSLWDYTLFPIVKKFRQLYPQISLRLITGHSDDIVREMMDGIIDIGLVYLPPHHPDFEVIPINHDSLRLVSHPAFMVEQESIKVINLPTLPYIHMNWGAPFSDWFQKESGNKHLPAFQVDHTSLLIRFLLSGEGIGFLLDSVSREFIQKGELKTISLQTELPLPERTTYLIYPKRKRNDTAVQLWLDHMLSWKKEEV
jgi:DNA-binding transcriptional LysR family regulator